MEFTILTKNDLIERFKEIGIEEGMTLIVHTSLKSFGYVVGGAETVIRSLIECVGDDGTIMMPSQTWKNLDPSIGVHWEVPKEYWNIIRQEWPAYDKNVTPAIGMGAVAEMLRSWPGSERSDHPARSLVAYGKQAKYLTENHDLSNIFGKDSPLDKLYKLNGHILLLGVGYDKNTSIHLAETIADFPTKKFTKESSAILVNGVREWVTYETQEVDDSDFIQLGNDYDHDAFVEVKKIGNANVRLLNQRNFVDYSVKWLEKNRK